MMRLVWEYGDTLTYSSIAADEVTYDSMFGTAIINLSAGDQVISFNGIMPIHIRCGRVVRDFESEAKIRFKF